MSDQKNLKPSASAEYGQKSRNAPDPVRYERANLILSALSFGIYLLVPALMLLTGASAWARDTIGGWTGNVVVPGAAVYATIGALCLSLITLPLSFYYGYVLEHRYGLSKQGIGDWVWQWVKGLALQSAFAAAFIAAIYALLESASSLWWIWASVLFSIVSIFLAAVAPVLLMPIFFKFEPLPEGELKHRLMALSNRLGTAVRGAYIWRLGDRTVKANAALAGWGRTRRIIISDTLMKNHTDDEIEVIIAHELGHHVNHDIWRGIAVQTILIFISMWAIDRALILWGDAFGLNGEINDYANLPLLMLVSIAVGVIALPMANTYSRHRETAADDFAMRVTGMRSEFASAMEKLADLNLSNRQPNWLIETVLHSHPSIHRRVQRARE